MREIHAMQSLPILYLLLFAFNILNFSVYFTRLLLIGMGTKSGDFAQHTRFLKTFSLKEHFGELGVVLCASIDKAQFSRIENSKTDPSFSTIEKIAKAMGCSISELFASAEEIKDIHSHDKSLMEKLTLIETLSDEEKQTLFNILDAFVSKKKYKDTLSGLLQDVK